MPSTKNAYIDIVTKNLLLLWEKNYRERFIRQDVQKCSEVRQRSLQSVSLKDIKFDLTFAFLLKWMMHGYIPFSQFSLQTAIARKAI